MQMKPFILLAGALCVCIASFAQSNKQVKWTFTAKKTADKIYEVSMTAVINGNYHLYSQDAGDGPLSTKFTFTANPLLSLSGKPKEVGKIKKVYEEVFRSQVRYYEKSVSFIQALTIKGSVKTNLAGKVAFLLCNDKECLPPSEIDFSVDIGG
jgi:thiol:disulfide interchange protein DsbD